MGDPKRYRTILADPPWLERGGGKIKRGADRHYPLMKTSQIKEIGKELEGVIHPEGCHLYLWVTNRFLPDGLSVMESWGFKYVTMATWAKDRFGLGQYRRGQTEHLLFGTRGKLPYKMNGKGKRCQASTLIGGRLLPRGEKHSQKPEEARLEIEYISYPPFLELFARDVPISKLFMGEMIEWDCVGHDVDGEDIIVGLKKLKGEK